MDRYLECPADLQTMSVSKTHMHTLYIKLIQKYYCIAGFCHEDFNVASHGIRNIKIHYIFYLVTFYHVRFCNCIVLCLYFSISLKSKWGLFQTLKEQYLMHKSIRNSVVSAIGIYNRSNYTRGFNCRESYHTRELMSFHFIFVTNFIRDKNPLYGTYLHRDLNTCLIPYTRKHPQGKPYMF